MKENELRLGNYVKTIQGNYKVSKIGYNELYICPFLTDDEFPIFINTLNPIQLTEEWLLKFGFEKQKDYFFRIDNKHSLEILFHDKGFEVLNDSVCLKHIKNVHQLQNLYFALKGEELTIK